MPEVRIREAGRSDAATIATLIHELAVFEKLAHEVRVSPEDILRDGFGARPWFECLLAEVDGEAAGFALFFANYSTFEGRPGIYLEDLFVQERARGLGIGRKLMARIAAIVAARGGARIDLGVLDWNPAREVYHRLGLRHLDAWLPYRLSGTALTRLAAEDG